MINNTNANKILREISTKVVFTTAEVKTHIINPIIPETNS